MPGHRTAAHDMGAVRGSARGDACCQSRRLPVPCLRSPILVLGAHRDATQAGDDGAAGLCLRRRAGANRRRDGLHLRVHHRHPRAPALRHRRPQQPAGLLAQCAVPDAVRGADDDHQRGELEQRELLGREQVRYLRPRRAHQLLHRRLAAVPDVHHEETRRVQGEARHGVGHLPALPLRSVGHRRRAVGDHARGCCQTSAVGSSAPQLATRQRSSTRLAIQQRHLPNQRRAPSGPCSVFQQRSCPPRPRS
mmetsp:Transcript_57767/g.135615  ORF Transcript_57767/g.135615 Transcript_57767/m.135615 type:complete len:250 (-) Transcript_57767:552-1301(-)